MALRFGIATTDRVNCGSAASLDNLQALTAFAWIYPTPLTDSAAIIGKMRPTATVGWNLRVSGTTGNIRHQRARATTSQSFITSNNTLIANAWNFVAVASDTGGAKIYHGNLIKPAVECTYGTATVGSGAFVADAARSLFIGNNDEATPSEAFTGHIDSAGVLNRVALVTEIQRIQEWTKQQLFYDLPGLVLAVYLGRALGIQPDFSPNNNHGTITGAIIAPGMPPYVRARRRVKAPAAGQTIAIAQVTETDLAHSINRLKVKAIGQITETDLAQLITAVKKRAIGQPAETDLAQAIAWAPKRRLVGQVAEIDLSQALTAKKLKGIAQALETDLAQSISALKKKTLGQPSETDLAQAINQAKIKAIAQATETELAQAISRKKVKLIGQASEIDLAQSISAPGSTIVAVAQASETDTAQAISLVLRRLVTQVSETDLSQAITRVKRKAIAQTVETNLAQAIISLKKKLIAQSVEIDLSQAISRAKRKEILQVAEIDFAQTVSWIQRRLVAQVEEIDLAQAIAVIAVALTRIQILVSGELVTGISLVGVQDDNLITVSQEFIDTVSITGKVELE